MRFRVLSSGYLDLAEARDFYESQSQGLGSYFLESVFTEVESLTLYAGIHRKVFDYHLEKYIVYWRAVHKILVVFIPALFVNVLESNVKAAH